MSKLSTDPYKGVRDFYPEDQFIENYIFSTWRKVLERSGYEEYNASLIESTEIYKEKSGDEIVNEQTFTFTDRGGREVTLRPEMTPTVARMVAAKRRELGFPLRWYSIPNLFRYEAPQRGRLREHWQMNADIFGVKGIEADIEIVMLGYQIMKAFGASDSDFEIRLNNNGTNTEALDQVIQGLKYSGVTNMRVDETLARGQTYYNGVVYEFFDTNPDNNRSIFGGGRYDNLTALFEDFEMPAVGIASGDVPMQNFLETHSLLPAYKPATNLFLVSKDTEVEKVIAFFGMVHTLQEAGLNIATDKSGRDNGDLYKVAERLHIPFIGFAEGDMLTVKNMLTREEKQFNSSDVQAIKDFITA